MDNEEKTGTPAIPLELAVKIARKTTWNYLSSDDRTYGGSYYPQPESQKSYWFSLQKSTLPFLISPSGRGKETFKLDVRQVIHKKIGRSQSYDLASYSQVHGKGSHYPEQIDLKQLYVFAEKQYRAEEEIKEREREKINAQKVLEATQEFLKLE